MNRKKLLALFIATLMVLSLASACNGGGGGGGGGSATGARSKYLDDDGNFDLDSLEWITFSMFIAGPGSPPGPNNEIVKMIEDATKVKIEFEFVVGDMDSRVGTMTASGLYPDLIGAGQARSKFMDAGAFIPLQDEIPKYPRLYEHFGKYFDKLRNASIDDNIYIMDIWGRAYGEPITSFFNGPAFWVQKEVIAWGGYKIPETLDELFGLLYAYFLEHPTIDGQPTLPFEILSDGWRGFCLMNPAQHLMGAPNDGDVFVKNPNFQGDLKGNYEAIFFQTTDYAKKYYEKLHEIFHWGMISAETFTQSFDQYKAKISSGRVLAMFDQQWNFEEAEEVLKGDDKWNRTYVPIGITYPGITSWYKPADAFVGGNGMGISVECKDPDRAMVFMDALLREDLTLLRAWGLEGRDYYVDENGKYRRTQEQRDNHTNRQWIINNAAARLTDHFPKIEGWLPWGCGNTVSPGQQPEEIAAGLNDYDREFFSHFTTADGEPFVSTAFFLPEPPWETPDYFPVWGFPWDDELGDILEQFQETQLRHLPRVIIAKDKQTFEAEWKTYMDALDRMAPQTQRFLDYVNAEIAKRMFIDR